MSTWTYTECSTFCAGDNWNEALNLFFSAQTLLCRTWPSAPHLDIKNRVPIPPQITLALQCPASMPPIHQKPPGDSQPTFSPRRPPYTPLTVFLFRSTLPRPNPIVACPSFLIPCWESDPRTPGHYRSAASAPWWTWCTWIFTPHQGVMGALHDSPIASTCWWRIHDYIMSAKDYGMA